MNPQKKFPWMPAMNIPPSSYANYLTEKSKNESFVSYALKHNILNQNKYFEWAVEYYQIPFLQDTFFDQPKLLAKKQWVKIKDLYPWNPEQLPVAVYEGHVFIACLEKKNQPGGLLSSDSSRFVLVSPQSLELMQNLINQFSSSSQEQKPLKNPTPQKILQMEHVLPDQPLQKLESQVSSQKTSSNRIPIEKQPDQQESISILSDLSLSTSTEKPIEINENFKAIQLNSSTEEEDSLEKIQSPEKESNLIKGDFKQKKPKTLDSPVFESSQTVSQNQTKIIRIKSSETDYEDLWKKNYSFFCASMVLKVRERNLHPIAYTGKITLQDKNIKLMSLNDRSLFRVCGRGHCYHGYVVDVPGNKDFFHKIGWKDYPKHISAIPIKAKASTDKEEDLIFIGLSLKALSEEKQKQVEKTVFDYFSPTQAQQKLSA